MHICNWRNNTQRSISNTIKLVYFLLLISGSYSSVSGQKLNTDSLKKIIATTQSDSTRILTMRTLANYYLLHEMNEKEGFEILDKAETEARQKRFYPGICNILLLRGTYAFQHGEWAKGLTYFKEQISLAANIKDSLIQKKALMSAYGNMGNVFNNNGDYATALDYYLKSLFIMETMDPNPTAICILHVNIASMYNQTEQYNMAEKYLTKMQPYLKAARPDLYSMFWSEKLTIAKMKLDSSDTKTCIDSLETFLKTTKMSKKQEITTTSSLLDMQAFYMSTYNKDYAGAIKKLEHKIELEKETGDTPQQYAGMKSVGELYLKMGEYGKAITILENTYKFSLRDSVLEIAFNSAKLLSEVYNKKNDKSKAFDYLLKAYQLNEQTTSQKKLSLLNFLEATYQSEKKEKEITTLTLSNTQKELTVLKRNRLLLIGGIIAGVAMLILGFMYRNSKNKQIIAQKEQKIKEEQIKFLERQQQIISLQSMLNGQETERTRIAKDLHDGLGGLFSTVKMYFSTLKHEQDALKENELFGKSYQLIDTASEEVRRIAHNMMPEVLRKLGLTPALQDMCSNISASKLIQVKLQSYGMEKRMNDTTEIMLYRIVQELLNNIIKHANATEAIVQFNQDSDKLVVTVEDNGRGFSLQETDDTKHAGLETVKSRVSYLNGNISIDSQKEVGTTIMMEFLINENA
jgi:signal transduction histidine kinase